MPSWNRKVTSGSDDCTAWLEDGVWQFSYTMGYHRVGHQTAAPQVTKHGMGMRFVNVNIPKGAIITGAYIRFRSAFSNYNHTVNTKIRGEAADSPVTFSDYADYNARPRTTATVFWDDIEFFKSNTYYNSPEIKTIIQEIISRAGWASVVVIFWDDHDGRSTTNRAVKAYESATFYAAELFVTYESPAVMTNPATSINHRSAIINGTLDDDGGVACKCGFEWGKTAAYGNTTLTESKTTGQSFSQSLTGLSPETTYHFRAFVTHSVGTGYGSDETFTTAAREYKGNPNVAQLIYQHVERME